MMMKRKLDRFMKKEDLAAPLLDGKKKESGGRE